MPSWARGRRKGRRTEFEYINGYVVARAAAIGRDVPANKALTEQVKAVERGAAKPDPLAILSALRG